MKKNVIIIAALACAVFAGCNSEVADPQVPSGSETIIPGGPVTFSATLPDTKSFDAEGKVSWETSDYIFVSTDKATMIVSNGTPDANGVRVSLADATISADGKTATFTVEGLAANATRYYAAAVDRADDQCILYTIWSNGRVYPSLGKMSGMNKNHKHHIAVATCTPGNTAMTFHNAGCVIRFRNPQGASGGKIQKLVVSGADGELLCHYYYYNALTGEVALEDHSYNKNKISYGYAKYTENNYLFLAPGQTFEHGLVITGYSDNEETDCLGTYQTAAFATEAGDFFDLGDIYSKLEKVYTSNYEKWNDGKDFVIGGKTYNKATNGAATLVSESGAISVEGNSVLFIKDGINVTAGKLGMKSTVSTCIVIGDNPSTRSSITLKGDENTSQNCAAADNLILSNLILSYGDYDKKLFRTYNNRNLSLYIDNCRFNYGAAIIDSGSAGQVLSDLVFMNSEIDLSNTTSTSHMSPMLRYWGTPAEMSAGSSIVFKNNIVFASESKRLCIIGSTGLSAAEVKYETVVFENNSFYNVNTSTNAMVSVNDVTTSVSIKNNLAYVPSGNRLAFVLASASDRSSFMPKCTITTDNKINTDPHSSQSGWGLGFLVGWGTGNDGQWLNTNYYIAENPFESFNTTTGANVKKAAYATNGATRE